MVDVFKVFYATHYNIGALSVLLLLLLIFLLSKKNLRVGTIVLAILVVLNVFVYKKTFNRSWTIEITPEKAESNDEYGQNEVSPEQMTFSVKKWSIVDDKGTSHHWCWVEDYWEAFSNTDLVAAIWGENAGKKVKKSTESRLDGSSVQSDE